MRNQLLRDTDWASMAHSLEVRVPLVDVELLRRVSPLLAKRKRRVSKRLLANSPRLPLPTKITERAKTGFVTPIETWVQRDSRVQSWRRIPTIAVDNCPWARRWAFEVAAA
jgi:asparagine synthase (glutamine-hydrolysing)